MKYKKINEGNTQRKISMLILASSLSLECRHKRSYAEQRVYIFKKPVKQSQLRDCLSEIQRKEKETNLFLGQSLNSISPKERQYSQSVKISKVVKKVKLGNLN